MRSSVARSRSAVSIRLPLSLARSVRISAISASSFRRASALAAIAASSALRSASRRALSSAVSAVFGPGSELAGFAGSCARAASIAVPAVSRPAIRRTRAEPRLRESAGNRTIRSGLVVTGAMIRVPGQNCEDSVELLGDQRPHDLVRHSEPPERDHPIGPLADARIEAVRPADHAGHAGAPLVPPDAHPIGKGFAGRTLAALVEYHERGGAGSL